MFSASSEARDRNAPTNANQIRLQTSGIRQEHRPIRYQLPARLSFRQGQASPFPLLAAVGAKTSRIEIGTAVIVMRYENPFYMAEDAGAADLIAGGRLQLGISRGSPEQVIDGWRYFGYQP